MTVEMLSMLQTFGFSVSGLLRAIVQYTYYILFGAILLSILINYLYLFLPSSGFVSALSTPVRAIADPILMPIRSVIPPLRIGGFGLDLSPIIAIIILSVASSLLNVVITEFIQPVTG